MVLSGNEQISIRVASGLLALSSISRKLWSPISWAVFLYILFRLIQWISLLAFIKQSLVLCSLLVAGSSRTVRAFLFHKPALIRPVSGIFSDLSGLCLRMLFFEAQDSIRQNQDFIAELVKQYIITFIQCLAIYLLLGSVEKLIWGSFWFNYVFFVFNLFVLLIRNTKDKWGEHRYRLWQSPNERTATHIRYKYMPLPTPRHVRLLLLHSRHPTGPVKCSLIPVLLEHAPRFEAISYTVCLTISLSNQNDMVNNVCQVGKSR
jgi:hypothetical protein